MIFSKNISLKCIFLDASQAEYDGVSEVKVDTSSDVLKLYPYHWCFNFLITLVMK